jgi:preprotein translocase subunit Sec63
LLRVDVSGERFSRCRKVMAKRDFYEVLGVERGASEADLKRPIAGWR